MADNGFSKAWLLAILVLLIAQAAFIKIITTDNAPQTGVEDANTPVTDEQGRNIIFVGEVELRIPVEVRRLSYRPVKPYEIFELRFCWQNELTTWTPDCPKDADIQTFLLDWTSSRHPYTGDAQEHLESRTKTDNGPFEGEIEGVNIYRHSTAGFVTAYALTTIDPSGIFPFASCNFDCRVQTRIHAQLHVQYHFEKGLIASWPQIHKGIRDTVESMLPRE